jgi:hypothetical protein
MIRLAIVVSLLATPVFAAETKKQSCGFQADIVAAIQQARKDNVRERDVPKVVAATNPAWPDNYNAAIPLLAPWVYDQKRKVVRNEDLSAAYLEQCLQN